jgi:nucleotide-binding universal stress UspA family protein
MYNKILVPLDGSKTAESALEHVKTIGKGCNVPEVDLLFVVEPILPGLYETNKQARELLVSWAKVYLAGVEKNLGKDGVNARPVVIEGKAADTILDYAAKNGIDVIVMSTHGRSGPSRWAFGSVAGKVLQASTVPVLICPK